MTLDAPAADTVVVVPMYNEGAVVAGVVLGLRGVVRRVVCVDDGSTDDSADAARRAGAIVLRHPTNLGQGAAIETGIRHALTLTHVQYVATFDADGQHDADDVLSMVERARVSGAHAVLGSRFLGAAEDMPASRRLVLSAAVRFTRWSTGLSLTDVHNGLRVLHRDAAEVVHLRLHGMSHASEILSILARGGFRVEEHPVTIRYTDYSRAKGQRSYNALNVLFELAVDRLRATA